jgi:amino acid permease
MATFVDIGVFFLNFGTAVVYLDVIGDVFCAWTGTLAAKRGLMFLVLAAAILPLSLIRDLDRLKYVSLCTMDSALAPWILCRCTMDSAAAL